MQKYEYLRLRYPSYYITLEEFCKINFCAKRTGRWLIEQNVLPAIDTGRKTWRYKIHIDDVITYLRRREQWGGATPKDAQMTKYSRTTPKRRSFSQVVTPGCESEVADYFKATYADYPDVLTTADVGTLTGLHHKSIMRIILEGQMKRLVVGRKYYVPKDYFLEFVQSSRFIDSWSNSKEFIGILEGFEKWRSKS